MQQRPQAAEAIPAYILVPQDQFTTEHKKLINRYRQSFQITDQTSETFSYISDVDSRFIANTAGMARAIGYQQTKDMEGKLYQEIPSDDAQQNAAVRTMADQNLFHILQQTGIRTRNRLLSNQHRPKGFKFSALDMTRTPIIHQESLSVLGFHVSGQPFLFDRNPTGHNFLLEYLEHFNLKGTLKIHEYQHELSPAQLTPYQQEICFFLLMDWSTAKIAQHFKKQGSHRHDCGTSRSAIDKAREAIAQKLGLDIYRNDNICEALVAQNLHRELPIALFSDPRMSVLR